MNIVYKLKNLLAEKGEISIAEFMEEVVIGNEYSYYNSRDAIGGINSDFITSPEISQLFGEMIGIWCAYSWQQLGCPQDFALVELGPGKGTMMMDALRAVKHVAGFMNAASIHMVEVSEHLTKIQQQKLAGIKEAKIDWHKSLYTVPDKPIILIANEFFDALPIYQYAKIKDVWHETKVTLEPKSQEFCFASSIADYNATHFLQFDYHNLHDGSFIETCPKATEIMQQIADRIMKNRGAALIIDYGYDVKEPSKRSFSPSLQAVKKHRFHPILADVGEADISAHVDFAMLKQAANLRGAKSYGTISQRNFLLNMGIEMRAELLLSKASLTQRRDIILALDRLISEAKMGKLFKVLAISDMEAKIAGFFEG
jgi:NADH dehydrogenase [ubiquinone] 1 alpha subcomplex assembly factor 7